MQSNTSRTLKAMRDMGRMAVVVERWNRFAKVRQDLFGFIDIIALDEACGIVGVQSCGSSFASHLAKITSECHDAAMTWLRCGGKIELWSWRKVKLKRGAKKYVWRPRVADFTLQGDVIKATLREERSCDR